jgi:lysophospholipase
LAEDAPLGPGSAPIGLLATDGVRLRAAILPRAGARGLAVLLQGRTETIEKYAPVAASFAERGFGVATLDWRGQGGSERPVGHPRKGHVDAFSSYQRDLAALLGCPEVRAHPGARVMVAHSMGGAIGLRALCAGDSGFTAAIFSAPMWGLAVPYQKLLRTLVKIGCALGLRRSFSHARGDALYVGSGFDGNVLTSDPAEFARFAALAREHPELALGAPTFGWLQAAFAEIDALRDMRLTIPSLAVVGSGEKVVSAEAIAARAFAEGHRVVRIEGARHEPFFDTPDRRAILWSAIDAYLAERGI